MKESEILKKLYKAQMKYLSVIGDAEAALFGKIDFDFSIHWQFSDGWTICHPDSSVATLEDALHIIRQKGILTYTDFKKICI